MSIEVRTDQATGETELCFRLPRDMDGGEVSVVGSFNSWTPGLDVLVDQGDGTRAVTVRTTMCGDVHFRYLGEGGVWFDDPEADEVGEYGSTVRVAVPSGPSDSAEPEPEDAPPQPATSAAPPGEVVEDAERATSRARPRGSKKPAHAAPRKSRPKPS